MKQKFILQPEPHKSRTNCIRAILDAPNGMVVTIEEPTRTIEQNAKLWAMLNEVSKQVDWYGNKLSDEDWKHVFTAALKKQKVVPGLDGGFVVCGSSTRAMSTKDIAELIELIQAFGSQENTYVNFRNIEKGFDCDGRHVDKRK